LGQRDDRSWQQALDLLDDESVAVTPHGQILKIQMLHHLASLMRPGMWQNIGGALSQ